MRQTAADAMFHEPAGSFRSWLWAQDERDDAIGDLARDLQRDRCLGQKRTVDAILVHVQSEHYPSQPAVNALMYAVREWMALH